VIVFTAANICIDRCELRLDSAVFFPVDSIRLQTNQQPKERAGSGEKGSVDFAYIYIEERDRRLAVCSCR
jgi:hypothetical protein